MVTIAQQTACCPGNDTIRRQGNNNREWRKRRRRRSAAALIYGGVPDGLKKVVHFLNVHTFSNNSSCASGFTAKVWGERDQIGERGARCGPGVGQAWLWSGVVRAATHLLAEVGEGPAHVGERLVIYDVPVEHVKLVYGHGLLLGCNTQYFSQSTDDTYRTYTYCRTCSKWLPQRRSSQHKHFLSTPNERLDVKSSLLHSRAPYGSPDWPVLNSASNQYG